MQPVIVGRSVEGEKLRDVWRAASTGSGRSIVVLGDAGIGKSAIVARAAQEARSSGMRVVEIEGVRGEEDLAWAGLAQLVSRIGVPLDRLPEHHAITLEIATGVRSPAILDRHAVFVAAQSLVTEATVGSSLLVVVDDLHWLDLESAQALVFLARRLDALPVSVVAATRDLRGLDVPDVLALGHLGADTSGEVIRLAASPRPVGPFVVMQLTRAAHGNPLALHALVDALSAAQLSGEEPLPNPLPLAPGLDVMLASRVQALPDDTRRALATLAMLGSASVSIDHLRAVAEVEAADLHPAESTDIVTVTASSVRFTHPLYRSAAYWTFDPPTRRDIHRRCAAAESDPVRRALHLADAAAGPDPELGRELVALAEGAVGNCAFTTATALFQRSRPHLTDDIERQRCDLATATAALAAGDLALARTRIREVPESLDPVRVRSVRAAVAEADGDIEAALVDWVEAARLARGHDAALAADQVITAGVALVRRVELALARSMLDQVDFDGSALDPVREVMLDVLRGATNLASGTIDDASVLAFSRYSELMDLDDDDLAPHLAFVAGVVAPSLALFRQHDAASAVSDRLDRLAVERTIPTILPCTETARGMIVFRGNVAAGLAHLEQAVSLAVALGHPSLGAAADGYLGVTQGQLGRADALDTAARLIGTGVLNRQVVGYMTLGIYWLTHSVPERALDALLQIHRNPDVIPQDYVARWQADLGEAAARCGRFEIAAEAVAELDSLLAYSSDNWLTGARERVLGMTCPLDEVNDHFGRSVAAMEASLHLSGIARSELLWGERLRRARRRAEARPHLERAREMFEQMGCGRWVERAELELVAAGAASTAGDHSRDAERVLTGQELHVARLAVAGASYKDIAGHLFVSPRTVESHLSAIYRKLGVKNRAGLSALAATDSALRPVS